eukprot:scaffold363_cov255-Pinguiococcus_pyrenoidosus.AAC.10
MDTSPASDTLKYVGSLSYREAVSLRIHMSCSFPRCGTLSRSGRQMRGACLGSGKSPEAQNGLSLARYGYRSGWTRSRATSLECGRKKGVSCEARRASTACWNARLSADPTVLSTKIASSITVVQEDPDAALQIAVKSREARVEASVVHEAHDPEVHDDEAARVGAYPRAGKARYHRIVVLRCYAPRPYSSICPSGDLSFQAERPWRLPRELLTPHGRERPELHLNRPLLDVQGLDARGAQQNYCTQPSMQPLGVDVREPKVAVVQDLQELESRR